MFKFVMPVARVGIKWRDENNNNKREEVVELGGGGGWREVSYVPYFAICYPMCHHVKREDGKERGSR